MTRLPLLPRLVVMEILLTPDLQAKLTRLAAQQGRAKEALVVEAVERMVNYASGFFARCKRAWRRPIAESL